MTEMEKINNLAIESAFGGILIPYDGDDLEEILSGLILAIHKNSRRKPGYREENEEMVTRTYPFAAGIEPRG